MRISNLTYLKHTNHATHFLGVSLSLPTISHNSLSNVLYNPQKFSALNNAVVL